MQSTDGGPDIAARFRRLYLNRHSDGYRCPYCGTNVVVPHADGTSSYSCGYRQYVQDGEDKEDECNRRLRLSRT